ncbi:MAG: hypothetical protein HYU64_16425 [Armatimonadetes bacterium]|nr:hypothetical protein [Armatimonadota bacterium]
MHSCTAKFAICIALLALLGYGGPVCASKAPQLVFASSIKEVRISPAKFKDRVVRVGGTLLYWKKNLAVLADDGDCILVSGNNESLRELNGKYVKLEVIPSYAKGGVKLNLTYKAQGTDVAAKGPWTGRVRMVGNEPHPELLLETDDRYSYLLTGKLASELAKRQGARITAYGTLTKGGVYADKGIEVTRYEVLK